MKVLFKALLPNVLLTMINKNLEKLLSDFFSVNEENKIY